MVFIAGEAFAGGCTLPVDVSNRIGRAQTFVYNIPDLAVLKGKRDYIWDGNTGKGAIPVGIFSGFYVTGDRAPYQGPNAGHKLAWYELNHPDWIVYRPDQTTPAWEFCSTLDASCDKPGGVPLAIWKPDVRAHMESGDVQLGLSAGVYQGISADNVQPSNVFVKAGTCSTVPDKLGCAHAGGIWTQRYSTAYSTTVRPIAAGAKRIAVTNTTGFAEGMNVQVHGIHGATYRGKIVGIAGDDLSLSPAIATEIASDASVEGYSWVDNQLARDWVTWLSELKDYVNEANLCLSINLSYNGYDRGNWSRVASTADIIFDEQGFGADPVDCSPGGGPRYRFYDQKWITKASDYIYNEKPLVLLGAGCTDIKKSRPEVLFNLATYLLIKGSHTYQALFYRAGPGGKGFFDDNSNDFYLVHGPATDIARVNPSGVWYRPFVNALALLNPSATKSGNFDLETNIYHDLDGREFTGLIKVHPLTGMILLPGEPRAPVKDFAPADHPSK